MPPVHEPRRDPNADASVHEPRRDHKADAPVHPAYLEEFLALSQAYLESEGPAAASAVGAQSQPEPVRLTAGQVAQRLAVTCAGAIVMALGVALSVIASLGVQPLTALPAVGAHLTEALGFPVTIGVFTFATNAAFFFGEMALLRGRFPKAQWLQLPLVLLFSSFIDLWLQGPLAHLVAADPVSQWVLLAVSIAVTALGVQLQVMGDTLITPPEAFMALVSARRQKPYGNVKVAFDVAFMVAGVALSLALLGTFADVSVGTLAAALLTGLCIRLWAHLLRRMGERLPHGRLPFSPLPLDAPQDQSGSQAR